jgi:hypothetical protein
MKRRFLIALTVAAAVTGALAGGVYAYWRTSGSGSGAASVGTAQAVTVEAATGIPTSSLQPNGTADLVVTLDNPNSYAVTIVGIVQNGPASPVSGGSCTSANSGVTVPTQTGLTLSVPSGAGQTVHIPNGAAMSASSDSNCQGVSFDITVTLTVQR